MPEEPSIKEANKTLRVLKGEKLKYTVTIYQSLDGRKVNSSVDKLEDSL